MMVVIQYKHILKVPEHHDWVVQIVPEQNEEVSSWQEDNI